MITLTSIRTPPPPSSHLCDNSDVYQDPPPLPTDIITLDVYQDPPPTSRLYDILPRTSDHLDTVVRAWERGRGDGAKREGVVRGMTRS